MSPSLEVATEHPEEEREHGFEDSPGQGGASRLESDELMTQHIHEQRSEDYTSHFSSSMPA